MPTSRRRTDQLTWILVLGCVALAAVLGLACVLDDAGDPGVAPSSADGAWSATDAPSGDLPLVPQRLVAASVDVPYPGPDRLDAVVADNAIFLDNGGRAGGVDGFGAHGVCVLRNRIAGTGIAGVDTGTDIYAAFGYPAAPSNHWRIVDNDVGDLRCVNDYGGLVAPIWLGTGSSRCLVIGGDGRPTKVVDQGVDNVLFHVIRLPLPMLSATRAAAPASAPRATRESMPVKKL